MEIEIEKQNKLRRNSILKGDQESREELNNELNQIEITPEMIKQIKKSPSLQANLYSVFIKKIRNNFHLVLNYSPSGINFK